MHSTHRRTRQRRAALRVGPVTLGLLALLAAGCSSNSGEPLAAAGPTVSAAPASDVWTTAEVRALQFALPPGWRRFECVDPDWTVVIHAPADPCGWNDQGIAVYGGATFDPAMGPGVLQRDDAGRWGGYVDAGDDVLYVQAGDQGLARRVLASARTEGQPVVEATQWERHSRGVIRYDVPRWWGVGEDGPHADYSVCVVLDRDLGFPPPEQVDASHIVLRQAFGSFAVTVTAPSQAVAELVMATVTVQPQVSRMDECSPETFTR